ncbi:MAG: methyltransferase domain-containing protein [Gammaproteobacteria bacterium]|jgi:ubiquinone/menaquinone biosynthesis C-methylase UbiE
MMQRPVDYCEYGNSPGLSLRFALWLLCLLLLAPLQAQEQSVRPGINKKYENPDWRQWVRTFENPRREVYAKRQVIVAASGVKPGMVVADIGAGTGLFTRLFAPKVAPTGKVYAVDISETFIENIMRTCSEQGLNNVEGIVNTSRETGLPADAIDLAFVTNTYHHFEYPQSMLASIRRALHRDGRLIVIDFRRDPRVSSPWIMGHVRAAKDTVIREIRAAGFRLLEDKPVLRSNYFLVFAKTGQ